MRCLELGKPPDVEKAVEKAQGKYDEEVVGRGFNHKDIKSDFQQWYTYCEQRALVEALIRAWAIVELPQIAEKYKVLAVEREIEPIEIAPKVKLQARVDAEMRVLETGDLHAYSLKTMKQWGEREEESYKSDLQGITEIWAIEQDIARRVARWQGIYEALYDLMNGEYVFREDRNILNIWSYFSKKKPILEKVMGVRFCFLLKGVWKKVEYDSGSQYVTYSPLIRGYKRVTPSGINYAHSWFYPNPQNRSGKGALGKGWEPFNVWEMEGGVKRWLEWLQTGEIQPECGDILRQQVITPIEYFRDQDEIEEAIAEVALQESRIRNELVGMGEMKDETDVRIAMARTFPHNRRHCKFHFGGRCEYEAACWAMEVKNDPIGSGLYEIRIPHHQKEKEIHGKVEG
jgi:hypothetical protein